MSKIKTTFTADTVEELRDMLVEAAAALSGATCTCDHKAPELTEAVPVIEAPTERVYTPTSPADDMLNGMDFASEGSEDVTTALVDADGYPWDSRIHSSNKKLTAAGVWQRRRGITDELVAEVKAELDAAQDDGPSAPPAAQETLLAPTTIAELMSYCTAHSIAPERLAEAVNAAGVESVPLLAQSPDKIPAVFEALV